MLTKETIKSGMTSLEIKFLVYNKWGSITAAARELGYSRSQLSYCILRKRISPAIKEKLAQALDMTVEELFGGSDDDETPEQDSDSMPGDKSKPGNKTRADHRLIRKKECI